MRYAPAVVALSALVIGSVAYAGSNPHVTFPLHARPTGGSCTQFAPVDCLPSPGGGVRPTVNVDASTDYQIYILVMNYSILTGMQSAYDWDASWVLNDVLINCRPGQVNATQPDPLLPGGGTTGALGTAFTVVNGPALIAIGRLSFTAGTAGCLFQVVPNFPFGNHVVGADETDIDEINANEPVEAAARLGKICVTSGGTDTCDPWLAVEPATWGSIKASFQ